MANRSDLTGLLTELRERHAGESFTVQQMIEAVEDRGFGPLLLLPALLVVTPLGAIPGVPTLMALAITLIAVQLVLGKHHPWLPARLRRMTIDQRAFEAAYTRALPVTQRIDNLLYPRLKLLTSGLAPRLIALLCTLLALIMIPLELLPFAAAAPATAIVLLALGLSVYDGLLVLLGLLAAAGGLGLVYLLQS